MESLTSITLPLRLATAEINRICEEIETAYQGNSTDSGSFERPRNSSWLPDQTLAKAARKLIRERELRYAYFDRGYFGEPAWDILLDLFVAKLTRKMISVSSACIGAGVPPTTALRHLSSLVEKGDVIRKIDPHDGRRIYVILSDTATNAIRSYLSTNLGEAP